MKKFNIHSFFFFFAAEGKTKNNDNEKHLRIYSVLITFLCISRVKKRIKN